MGALVSSPGRSVLRGAHRSESSKAQVAKVNGWGHLQFAAQNLTLESDSRNGRRLEWEVSKENNLDLANHPRFDMQNIS